MELRTVGQVYEREPFGADARQLLAQNFELNRATCVIWTRRVAELVREVEDRRRGSFTYSRRARYGLLKAGVRDQGLRKALGADYYDRLQEDQRQASLAEKILAEFDRSVAAA